MKRFLGPVLLQLPPNLGFHHEKTEKLFSILKEKYSGYKIAVEIRHESWLEPPVINLFKRFQITWVIADSGRRFPMAENITAKDIYIRFHGPDGSYATGYTSEELKVYAKKCIAWSARGHRIWLFFNNDIHGYAIENARTIKKILQM